MRHVKSADEVRALVAAAAPPRRCNCTVGPCAGWESISEDRWPSARMKQLATLRDANVHEPTFEEFHPNGTRYDSPQAPVAPAFFPYNRCDLWQCTQCDRLLLRYTEFGGYYVDHRVRTLKPELIVE